MRKIQPRLQLRYLDSQSTQDISGSYNDNTTVLFETSTISLPTTLKIGSHHLSSDLTSSINFTATTRKSAIENWISKETDVDVINAFFENDLHEQDLKGTNFYLTGTSPNDVGFGFEGSLGQKTIFRYELPISTALQLPASDASLSYYDSSSQTFKGVGSAGNLNRYLAIFSDAQLYTAFGTQVGAGLVYGNAEDGYDSYYQSLSNPLLNSNSNNVAPFKLPNPYVMSNIDDDMLKAAYQHVMVQDSCINKKHSFDYLDVTPIVYQNESSIPYLLEKISLEIPLEAGPGWFDDRTYSKKTNHQTNPEEPIRTATDVGGPCITVGLIKESYNKTMSNFELQQNEEIGPNSYINFAQREIIAKGTIIPYGDSFVGTKNIDLVDNPWYVTTSDIQLALTGFSAYAGEPTCIVVPNGSNQFTGSVRMDIVPEVENLFYYSFGNCKSPDESIIPQNINPTASYGYGKEWLDLKSETSYAALQNLKAYCKGGTNLPSARSIFGKERSTYEDTLLNDKLSLYIENPWNKVQNTLSSSIDVLVSDGKWIYIEHVGVVKKSVVSPYLIMPGDKITFFVSKYRPVKQEFYKDSDMNYFSSRSWTVNSHDVKVSTGSIKISMYGSYVSEKREIRLPYEKNKTDSVTEVIGNDPVVDRYDLSDPVENIGTYYDEQVTGSGSIRFRYTSDSYGLNNPNTLYSNTATLTARSLDNYENYFSPREPTIPSSIVTRLSERRPIKELLGLSRVSSKQRYTCYEEREYDSIPLKIDEALAVEGTTARKWNPPYTELSEDYYAVYQLSSIDPETFGSLIVRDIKYTYFNWLSAFPFEPAYSGVSRKLTSKQSFNALTQQVASPVQEVRSPLFLISKTMTDDNDIEQRVLSSSVFVDYDLNQGSYLTPTPEDVDKFFFGFGDHLSSSYDSTNETYQSHVGLPTFRYTQAPSISVPIYPFSAPIRGFDLEYTPDYESVIGPMIRGWKYGLSSALPMYSSCVFSKKSYGQFRDMLEQRKFTVFYDNKASKPLDGPVNARFVSNNNDGTYSIVDPEKTLSINLSSHATSSLPYFDGDLRERSIETLMEEISLNTFVLPA